MNPRKRRLLKMKAAQAATVAEEAAPVVEKKAPAKKAPAKKAPAKKAPAPKKSFGRKKTVE
jgi:hypothetical protein